MEGERDREGRKDALKTDGRLLTGIDLGADEVKQDALPTMSQSASMWPATASLRSSFCFRRTVSAARSATFPCGGLPAPFPAVASLGSSSLTAATTTFAPPPPFLLQRREAELVPASAGLRTRGRRRPR
ncbi:hypothetical protein ZWY2020_047243 [Hordeum vulgare]|nr:hypothetical protein ZWY2020_047243 [Hordeum vulgare]